MALVLSLDHVREADEAQAADVDVIQAAVIAARVSVIMHWPEVRGGQARGQVVLPAIGHVVRDAGDGYGGGLMARVGNNFDGIGIKMIIGDGLGGVVEHRRHVVLGYDVAWDRRRVRHMSSLLDITFEYLAAGW